MPNVVPDRAPVVPWYSLAALFASTCIVVGLVWDVSWHRTVGRDTFFTPPHLLQQVGAMVAGLACGFLVLRTTFKGTPAERDVSVRFWGFRGPLGAWVCIWATLVIITSAPFDDWWHQAYGLDIKLISPPHTMLALGMLCLQLGAVLLVLAAQNRATGSNARRLGVLLSCATGLLVLVVATLSMEHAGLPNHMHSSRFYMVTATVFPFLLVGASRTSAQGKGATSAAAVYMVLLLAMVWILPLFAAQPKLAPVFNPVTHMVPPPFPLLLVIPALAIDALQQRFGRMHDWRLSAAMGIAFVAIMLAVHWFWAEFLLSPAARNAVFRADNWEYFAKLGNWRYQYWNLDGAAPGTFKWGRSGDITDVFNTALFARGLVIAVIAAIVSSRVGLWLGNWMSTVKR